MVCINCVYVICPQGAFGCYTTPTLVILASAITSLVVSLRFLVFQEAAKGADDGYYFGERDGSSVQQLDSDN